MGTKRRSRIQHSKAVPAATWTNRYGAKHRWQRLTDFPSGLRGPTKVRVYSRNDHFILQWWDPGAKRNLAERIDGDLLAALLAARKIDERLADRRSSGVGKRRLGHDELVERYQGDLQRRADAGDLSVATVRRFSSALRHYEEYTVAPATARAYPYANTIDRSFRLDFEVYLAQKQIHPNGHAHSALRPMKGSDFITDTVRAMLEWAADPERGNLLADTFRNPFRKTKESRTVFKGDPFAEPDITLPMALDFVGACDLYQLRLFAPIILFGLRAAEPCLLFHEHVESDWLRVCCIPELEYFTKGRRDKRFPLISELRLLWTSLRRGNSGPMFLRRAVEESREQPPLLGAGLVEATKEYRRRCAESKTGGAVERGRLRNAVLRDTGAIGYDQIEQEFRTLAKRLAWPPAATLKDFRHLFATTLGNTAMPEVYRKFLMGHHPGNAAILAYTHLNRIREHYTQAVMGEWASLLEAIRLRLAALEIARHPS